MKKIILTLFALLTITFVIKAQQQVNRCGTTEYTDRMKANDPSMQQRMNEIEHNLEVWMANHPTYNMKYIITIPVVVHVVYNTAAQNISDDQIRSQIDVLNEDYNRRNADTIHTPDCFKPLAGSMPINFCLASRDPQGNWTNGIVRVQTNVPCFSDDAVKYDTAGGSNIWDPNTYCNIWVCNECGDVLGYGTYPGGGPTSDGVVSHVLAFGRGANYNLLNHYNLGRTTTHEVGHWLNLYHPWGQGGGGGCTDSDDCFNTPYQDGPTYGCPSGPQISCNNGPCGNMYEVYMDYTDDACMNMFATCEINRMVATLNGTRQLLLNSNGCLLNDIPDIANIRNFSIMPNPANEKLTIEITLDKLGDINYSLVNILGDVVFQNSIGMEMGGKYEISTRSLPAGIYSLRLNTAKESITRKVVIIH